jgi:hypothetical protein
MKQQEPVDEAARWKERYLRFQAAYQEVHSELMRTQVKLEAAEARLKARSDIQTQTPEERAAAKADAEATRRRRFQERVAKAAEEEGGL